MVTDPLLEGDHLLLGGCQVVDDAHVLCWGDLVVLEVVHIYYLNLFDGELSSRGGLRNLGFRMDDWGVVLLSISLGGVSVILSWLV